MTWAAEAIGRLDAEAAEVGPTPLRAFPLPPAWGITLWLKDESAHPTGSLKHRTTRSLFRYAIACGQLTEGTPVVEATGGAAAEAQAYFARLLRLPYVAVMPGESRPERAEPVERLGGEVRFHTPPLDIYHEARRLADRLGGHYLDQFRWAERAADWRAPSLADELFGQLPEPPGWVVVSAGTGATAAVLGRHIRSHGLPTRLAVADPENSAYFPGWATGAADYTTGAPSRIEGAGRPRMEPGFIPSLVDVVMPVPDAASVAAARLARTATGLPVGGSTGTNLRAALELIAGMHAAGEQGTVVTLIADSARRHLHTYHDDGWAAARGLDPAPYAATLAVFLATGQWPKPS